MLGFRSRAEKDRGLREEAEIYASIAKSSRPFGSTVISPSELSAHAGPKQHFLAEMDNAYSDDEQREIVGKYIRKLVNNPMSGMHKTDAITKIRKWLGPEGDEVLQRLFGEKEEVN